MSQLHTVWAVISAFNPPDDLVDKVQRLLSQVEKVIVVDDGSTARADSVLERLREVGARVIELGTNKGIATALNVGMKHSVEAGATMVLTLDQDSEIDGGYVKRALDAYNTATESGVLVGIVCAQSHNKLPVMLQSKNVSYPEAFDPMQSGTLIPASTLQSIGYFDESLFIDCVDSEYTARLRNAGMRAMIAEGCNITHAVGESRPMRLGQWHVNIGGRKRFVHSHAPFRVYYITRNGIVLYRAYARSQPRWVVRRIGLESIFYAVRIAYGPYRSRQLLAIAFGILDAIRGRTGRLTDRQDSLLRARDRR